MAGGDQRGGASSVEARLARIEANQHALAELAKATADGLEVQRQMLAAILGAMEAVAREMRVQTALLQAREGDEGHGRGAGPRRAR